MAKKQEQTGQKAKRDQAPRAKAAKSQKGQGPRAKWTNGQKIKRIQGQMVKELGPKGTNWVKGQKSQ